MVKNFERVLHFWFVLVTFLSWAVVIDGDRWVVMGGSYVISKKEQEDGCLS